MKCGFCSQGDISCLPSPCVIEKCVKKATEFQPCLCPYRSDKEAIIDLYLINKSLTTLIFKDSVIGTGLADGSVPDKTRWILPPPPLICPGQTVFLRLYSGLISTSNPNICISPVQFGFILQYMVEGLSNSIVEIDIFRVRPALSGDCEMVGEFGPISVDFYDSESGQVEIFYVQPPLGSTDWVNTALFLLS